MATKQASVPVPTEDQEQAALFDWARMAEGAYPELQWFHAIPNGGKRNIVTASKMKATGTKPGVPDTFLPVPRNGYHGLYIELKRRKGGRISPEQKKCMEFLRGLGYRVEVCMGFQEAVETIKDYLNMR